ncbi:MAG: ABC transporter permease subunit [Myxococcota bacterium]|nr:ABC transporter permease subunit [Myxococcota bacterium]
MIGFLVRRTLAAVSLVFVLSFVLFALLQAMPGSMEDMLMSGNPNIRPEDVARLKRMRGLDQPVHVQYARWMWGYHDTTGGFDELTTADGQVLVGRLADEDGQLAAAKGWTADGSSLVLETVDQPVDFVVDGGELQTYEGAQRLVRRQVDLGKPPKDADFFVASVQDDEEVGQGQELGKFYRVTLETLESMGLEVVRPPSDINDLHRDQLDPTEAAHEAGSNRPEGEAAAEVAAQPPVVEGDPEWTLVLKQDGQDIGTVRLKDGGRARLEPKVPASAEGKTEAQINLAVEKNREAMLGLLTAHAEPVEIVKAPMVGYAAFDSPRPFEVVAWRSIGLMRAGAWKGGLLSGNLGWSLKQEKVSTLIQERIVNTLRLMGPALLLSILIALPLGMAAAVRQYSLLDHSVNLAAFIGISLPVHWFGLMLIHVFAVWLALFPVSGLQTPGLESFGDKVWHTVLPVTVLSIAYVGRWLRYMRASMLEVIKQDYIRTARAKGVPEQRVIFVHAFRNALIPVVTILALSVPVLFGGALITETIFSWPGMGSLIYEAIIGSDYYVAIIGFLISASLVMVGNLLADVMYAVIDPRVRVGE